MLIVMYIDKELAEEAYTALRKMKFMRTRFKLDVPSHLIEVMLEQSYRVEVESRGGVYTPTEALHRHIRVISKWLSGEGAGELRDKSGEWRVESGAVDNKFGAFLCGRCGNGKTTMLRAVRQLILMLSEEKIYTSHQSYPLPGVRFVTAKEVVAMAKAYHNPGSDNKDLVNEYKNLLTIEVLCIDDLGEEVNEISFFGERITPLKDVLMRRYDERLCTIVSSNMSPLRVASQYDERLADRFREMMHVVNFADDASFRG